METVEFVLDTQPVPAARPRVFRNGGVAYPKAHTQYHQWLKTNLKKLPSFNGEGLIEARMLFILPPYKGSDYPTHRTDLDNLSKLPLDTMTQSVTECGQARFWMDDSLVVSLMAFKRFARQGEASHTKIRMKHIPVEEVDGYVERMFYQ